MTQGGLQQEIVEDIYDEVWTRPSLFRLEFPSWRSGLEPPAHGAARPMRLFIEAGSTPTSSTACYSTCLAVRSHDIPRAGGHAIGNGVGTISCRSLRLRCPGWSHEKYVSFSVVVLVHSPFSLSRNVMARPHTDANNDRTTLNIVVPVTAFRRRFLPRNMSLEVHAFHACPKPRQRQLLASCKIR